MKKSASKTRRPKPATGSQPNNKFVVERSEEETPGFATARALLAPDFRHAVTSSQIHKAPFGSMEGAPGFSDYADAIRAKGDAATKGDLAFATRMLAAQAVTLDNIFTEMARRMALNMSEYLGATETYGRLAMKAQAQSRAALEALAKFHQPREQTVKHVHVNEGGQAVVADHFHAGGEENAENVKQSHATGAVPASAALPSPDPEWNGVPITSREREAALQNARRDESGSA